MNSRQKQLVQMTFAQVAAHSELAAGMFYKRLFQLDPGLRHMFHGDMQEQGRKLMNALALVVAGLEDLDRIIPAVQQLGRRHARYGVTNEHYWTVASALVWALKQALGPDFTAEVEDAWIAAYVVVAGVMKAAAAEELLDSQAMALEAEPA